MVSIFSFHFLKYGCCYIISLLLQDVLLLYYLTHIWKCLQSCPYPYPWTDQSRPRDLESNSTKPEPESVSCLKFPVMDSQ